MQQPTINNGSSKALLYSVAAARELGLFLLFVAAYCLPLALDNGSGLQFADTRVRHLLGELLATPVVRGEIARNLGGHLLLLVLPYLFLAALSRQLATACGAALWAMRLPVFLAGWVFLIAVNAAAFPKSDYSVAFTALARPELAYGLGLLLFGGLAYLLYRTFVTRRWLLIVPGLIGGGLLASGFARFPLHQPASPSKKNVIIVGVDSMSAVAFGKLAPSLPNLRQLMESGVSYERAYTPLGRTFPAWVSILSGKSPVEHGAIFNLRNMESVARQGLISSELRSAGYRTVYAIDERRFNNIDQDFGFDHVIGPRAGGLDFLAQRLNDTPLSNMLLQTGFGRMLMPFSYINTASYTNYDADAFVDLVLNATAGAAPLFLAVHFESAHFPFATRHAHETFAGPNPFWNRHAAALTVVDQQVGQLVAGLQRQGFLQNALVIVLSDHGEGLGELEATLNLDGKPTPIQVYGHGSHVVSDHENHIVLGVIDYKDGRPSSQSTDARQVSLLDLKPLISRYVATGDTSIVPSGACMFVETGERFSKAEDYRTLDQVEVAADSARFYEIDLAGRMRLREGGLRELAATKDVGVRCRDHLTYQSVPLNRYFTLALDESGLPTEELPLNGSDIRQIESYRARLQATLPAASSSL